MNRAKLRHYVLQHPDDQEAWDIYIDSRSPDDQAIWYTTEDPKEIDEILKRKIKS